MKAMLAILVSLWAAHASCLEVEQGSRARLTELLEGQGDVLKRTVERIGNRTIQIRLLISADADFASAKKIFGNPREYREWALRNINMRSNGSSYYVKFLGCDPMPNGNLFFPIRVDLPVFGRDLIAHIAVRTEERDGGFVVHARTNGDEHPQTLGTVDGYLFFFPAPREKRRLYGELRGNLQLVSGFLYEALPERLLIRETSERIQTLLENYRDREMRRLPAESTTSQ